jgi:hypothetical protein
MLVSPAGETRTVFFFSSIWYRTVVSTATWGFFPVRRLAGRDEKL